MIYEQYTMFVGGTMYANYYHVLTNPGVREDAVPTGISPNYNHIHLNKLTSETF
jgi:hypothetical protein